MLTNLLSWSLLGASTTRSASRSGWFVGKYRANTLRFKFWLPRARSKQLILKSLRVFEAINIEMLRSQTGIFLVETFYRQLESKHGVIYYLSEKHGNLYSYLFCFSLGCCNQRRHSAAF